MEKFAHLVDKLHRSVALCESLRQEKSQLEAGLQEVRLELAMLEMEQEVNNGAIQGQNAELRGQEGRQPIEAPETMGSQYQAGT